MENVLFLFLIFTTRVVYDINFLLYFNHYKVKKVTVTNHGAMHVQCKRIKTYMS